MFVVGYLLRALSGLLHFTLQVGIILFAVRAVMSWFQPDPRQPLISFVYGVTDPVLDRLRRVIPPFGAVDLSPMIAILLCWFLDSFLVPSLRELSLQFLP